MRAGETPEVGLNPGWQVLTGDNYKRTLSHGQLALGGLFPQVGPE